MSTNQPTNGTPLTAYKPCSIKLLPAEKWIDAANGAIAINPANAPALPQLRQALPGTVLPPEHLALLTSKYWGSAGVQLTVGFLDDAPDDLQARILSHMNAWNQYTDVSFVLAAPGTTGQVRITFTTGDGYWSYLGTDIQQIDADQPTMNLDSFSMDIPESEYRRVVRHETGHTLGFPHEHMRPEIVADIDPVKATAFFLENQGWNAAEVQQQVLTPYDQSALTVDTPPDPLSIMCYALPGQIMKDGVAVPGGIDIDEQDAAFAASVYPK